MARDEQSIEEADIQVGPSDDEEKGLKGGAKKALAMPTATVNRLRVRYKHLNKRDKFAVLLFVLVVIMVVVIMSIWTTGGGIGGPDLGPEIRPPSDWNIESLQEVDVSGEGENSNLEGQETPYLVPLNPAPGEIFFVTNLFVQVDWADESTPPTQAPAIGYTNQPDGFMLKIRVHDDVGEWESELVFNSIGSSKSVFLDINVGEYLGQPIIVANREGADYLPQGYVENIRIDFIIVTEDCGDWTSSDPFRPTIGDAGNHFTCDWFLLYRQADSTKEP